jgi:hypothetical protein
MILFLYFLQNKILNINIFTIFIFAVTSFIINNIRENNMFKKNIKKLFFSLLSILILSMSVFFGANACATQERINIEGPQLLTGKLLEDGEYFYNAKYMSSGDSVENST